MVYFGYPQTHEDDSRRAVLTGLALVAELPPSLCNVVSLLMAQLAVRVGIHTGLVVTVPKTDTMQSRENQVEAVACFEHALTGSCH